MVEAGTLNVIQRYNVLFQDKDYEPVGPTIGSRQETHPGEPMLPLIVEGSTVLGPVTLSSELHYHHQLHRVTESTIAVRGRVPSDEYVTAIERSGRLYLLQRPSVTDECLNHAAGFEPS